MKLEFEKIRAVIGELADVLDEEFPKYVIEEDKTLKYKQMIISKQDKKEDVVVQEDELKQRSKYHPFDDELQFKFYVNLPDYKKHVISQEEAQEIQRIETIENDELMSIELRKQQEINNQLEREGKMPGPLPDEAQLLAKVAEMKSRSINQWMDVRFDDFMRKCHKNQSQEQIDKRAEDFIEGNNSVHMKMPRKRIAKIIFNVSKNYSSNLQLLPTFARFIAIVNQYFPEIG